MRLQSQGCRRAAEGDGVSPLLTLPWQSGVPRRLRGALGKRSLTLQTRSAAPSPRRRRRGQPVCREGPEPWSTALRVQRSVRPQRRRSAAFWRRLWSGVSFADGAWRDFPSSVTTDPSSAFPGRA